MRKLLIIMTAVFGLCFSINGNAKDKLTWEENRNIVLKGEVISSFAYKTGEINNLITIRKDFRKEIVKSAEGI